MLAIPLNAEVVMVLFTLDEKVAENLRRVDEAAATERLEESGDRYCVIDNTEHLIDIKIVNHCAVVENSQVEHPIVKIAERKHVSIGVLSYNIAFDKVSKNHHVAHRLDPFHEL